MTDTSTAGPICTTLAAIRSHNPCVEGWAKLLKHLGKHEADDEPLPLVTILDSNGLDDTLWCLRSVDGYDREIRLYGIWCARQVQHLMTDQRSIAVLDVAERYASGQVTVDEWTAARRAAREAARDAAGEAARAAAWDTAMAAARDAAGAAAGDAPRAAAGAAASAAAWAAGEAARKAGDAALEAARAAARTAGDAAWGVAGSAGEAAREAADAAREAADAAREAADAAWDAAWDAAREAAWDAAWDAARSAQEARLMNLLKAGEWND